MIIINILIFALLLFFNSLSYCQNNERESVQLYDSVYAAKLGADDYGMKTYVMAFLKSGKVVLEDKTESQRLQIEHLKNIVRLADEGKLLLAGPFLSDKDIRGIYIFDVKTVEEARKLTETDPAIIAGVLEMVLLPWYGSAALMELNTLHKKVQKISITD